MNTPFRVISSVSVAIDAVGDSFSLTPKPENPYIVRICGDEPMHLAYNTPATTDDAYIPSNVAQFLSMGPEDTIHVVKKGIGSDGVATISVVG